jgi:hypothetical protein
MSEASRARYTARYYRSPCINDVKHLGKNLSHNQVLRCVTTGSRQGTYRVCAEEILLRLTTNREISGMDTGNIRNNETVGPTGKNLTFTDKGITS